MLCDLMHHHIISENSINGDPYLVPHHLSAEMTGIVHVFLNQIFAL